MLFHRETPATESYCRKLTGLIRQVFNNRTLFPDTFLFIPDHPRTGGASILPLIKILFSTKHVFCNSLPDICSMPHFQQPFTLLSHRTGNPCTFCAGISSICKHNGAFSQQHKNLFNFFSNTFFITLHVSRIAEETCPLFLK